MLEAVPRRELQLAVAELLIGRRAVVLPGQARSRDTLVVGGERHGDLLVQILAERVVRPLHLEDLIVAAEAHLDEDALLAHLRHEARRIGLGHHVHAVTDALGVPGLDGVAHVERVGSRVAAGQVLGHHLAGVERHVEGALLRRGVLRVEEVEHRHVQIVVLERRRRVLRRREVQGDELRRLGGHLVRAYELSEQIVQRPGPGHLRDVAHADLARRRGGDRGASERLLRIDVEIGDDLRVRPDRRREARVARQRVVERLQVGRRHRLRPHRARQRSGVLGEVEHGLHVDLVLIRRALHHVGDVGVVVRAGDGAVLPERGEEVIVPGLGAGDEVLHRPRAHDLVEEGAAAGDGLRAGRALAPVHDGERAGVDTVAVRLRPAQVRLRVHRAGEVVVQIAPLGDGLEERGEVRRSAEHRVVLVRRGLLPLHGARGGRGARDARRVTRFHARVDDRILTDGASAARARSEEERCGEGSSDRHVAGYFSAEGGTTPLRHAAKAARKGGRYERLPPGREDARISITLDEIGPPQSPQS